MRAAIYCRLSFNPDGASIGLDAQRADGEKLAEKLGATVTAVITDGDVSAASSTTHRPGFEQLVTGLLAGDYDIAIAWDQSRLTRNPTDLERVVLATKAARAQLWTVRQGRIDTDSPEGKAFSRVINVFDSLEVEKAQLRTQRAMAERAQKGLPLSGVAGFGYRKAPGADNYEIVEHEADEIRAAAARILDGESLASVAADWQARGVENRSGGVWRASAVRRILLAPRTAGLRGHQGKVVGKAAWSAILDDVTYQRVRRVLSDPRRRTANDRTAKLLTGTVECGGCLNTMNHKVTYGRGKYYCRHCRSRLIGAAELEAFVRGLVVRHVDHTHLRPVPHVDESAAAKAELIDVEERIVELAAQWAAGTIGTTEWDAARTVLAGRKRQLEAAAYAEPPNAELAEWLGRGADLDSAWEAMSVPALRRLIRASFRWIRVGPAVQGLGRFDPDRVTFEYAG